MTSFAPRDAELLQRNLHKLNDEPFKEIALDADDIRAMRKWWDVSPYKEGDVTDARMRNGVWECLRTAQQSVAAEKAERRAAKREKAERAAEAQKAAAAMPRFYKKSPNWWREALETLTENVSDLTLDELCEHFGGIEDEFADSFERRKGNARGMLFDAIVGLHVFMLQAREKRISVERRVEELERRPALTYEGVWTAQRSYGPGMGVTHQGSFWVAKRVTATGERPGMCDGFQLAIKKGRDARPLNPEKDSD